MKNLLKLAFMSLKRSSLVTVLDLIGLTGASVVFLLIILFVWHEYHFDCYNTHANEIYRIEIKLQPNDTKSSIYLKGATGQALTEEFPEIIASTIYMPWGKFEEEIFRWQTPNGKVKKYEDYAYSDEKLTDIFSFNFIKGDREHPLLEPQSAIISESFAREAWGTEDPTGKQLEAGNLLYTVTSVFADQPENSVIQCPVILKIPSQGKLGEEAQGWGGPNYPQFLLTKPGTDQKLLTEKINRQSNIRSNYMKDSHYNVSPEFILRPLRNLHFAEFTETYSFSSISPQKRSYVRLLFFVGLLIILVALINHINFATANVPQRIKSISIYRIIGSNRFGIVKIYLIETLVVLIFSYLIALILAYIINGSYSRFVFGYTPPFGNNLKILLIYGAGYLMLGLIAGIYPGLYSSSRKPVDALKRFSPHQKRINFRNILTISQFVVTIALVVVSITIIKQVRFMETAELGYEKNGIMVIELNDEMKKNTGVYENSLRQCSGVKDFAYSFAVPGSAMYYNTLIVDERQCPVWYWAVDADYLDLLGFQLAEGRKFIKNSQAEEKSLICNETAAKKYGWKLGTETNSGILVGILKDFNYVSLQKGIDPFVFWYSNSVKDFNSISLKLTDENIVETIESVRKVFEMVSLETPLKYYFLDEHLNLLYQNENQQVKLITSFCILSVIISILGLFGLSIFIIQSKVKEIGIRKVNGAKIFEILALLNKDFVLWVVIAFVIATPIAYFAMNKWLENFAYKTSLSWWIFALAGLLALGIALLTVSFQSWKAATKNPVESLRYE